jgi:predicted nuclease of predicted toxin-antitoxin system
MKILIDECLPRKLKHELPGHEAHTVPEMGWASKKNGELLALMAGKFDVFLTVDNNLQYQQNTSVTKIAFIVLVACNNTYEILKPLMSSVINTLATIQPGEVVQIKEGG